VAICYISPSFGILCQEKSGNPDENHSCQMMVYIGTYFDTKDNNCGTF
jgi:hypothetical protein